MIRIPAATLRARSVAVGLVLTLLAFAYLVASFDTFGRADLLFYDYLMSWRGHQTSDRLVVVAIDDTSVQEVGRWPWSRRVHARLLQRLTAMGAAVVGYDVLFPEAQSGDPLADRAFADAIEASGVTVLAVAPSRPSPGATVSEILPLPELAAAAAGIGHVAVDLDRDGLCRAVYLHAGAGEAYWPSLGLAMLRAAGEAGEMHHVRPQAEQFDAVAGWRRTGRYLIPYDTGQVTLNRISAVDVLNRDDVAARIAGRYVLVGSSATGLGDVVTTPVSFGQRRMAGVELNAHILSGLLNDSLVREMPTTPYRILTLAIAAVLAMVLVSSSFPTVLLSLSAGVVGVLVLSGGLLAFAQLWFPPSAAISVALVGLPLWGAWVIVREKSINESLSVQVRHRALHHPATDLPNQALLDAQLQALDAGQTTSSINAMLMILHLKWSGSAGGLAAGSAGDQLLRAVARRIGGALRRDDLVAHLCGDDFGILVKQLDSRESAIGLANNLLGVLQRPFALDGSHFFLSPRIGLSLWPQDTAEGEALLRNAYIAMFRARVERASTPCVYSDEVAQAVHDRSRLEHALINALERNEFEVYYQPQVVSRSGRITGVEALLRWHNPELGLVLPGTFIPVAEHTGLIDAIGAWVLRSACTQAQAWNAAGLGPVRIAVNLSALQFGGHHLIDDVRDALEASGLAPGQLELEITESAVMQNLDQATKAMQRLKAQGVTFAIDDFGTGYSALSNLRQLPLDRIKIDQSFTRELNSNAAVREITQTIIGMARRLNLQIVAEGVETRVQADFLDDQGCHELQGFLFSRPVPATEMGRVLRREVIAGDTAVAAADEGVAADPGAGDPVR